MNFIVCTSLRGANFTHLKIIWFWFYNFQIKIKWFDFFKNQLTKSFDSDLKIFESESFDSNIWFCSILKIDYDDLDSQKIKYQIKTSISKTKITNKGPNYHNLKIQLYKVKIKKKKLVWGQVLFLELRFIFGIKNL